MKVIFIPHLRRELELREWGILSCRAAFVPSALKECIIEAKVILFPVNFSFAFWQYENLILSLPHQKGEKQCKV